MKLRGSTNSSVGSVGADDTPFIARLIALALLLSASAAFAQLPTNVAKALSVAGIPESSVGVVVQALDAPKPTLAVGGNSAMNPASTMKLLTTFAALELLGPAYTWQTEIWASATPNNSGVLQGDLYLKGSGDPKLTYEHFWRLLRQTHDAGISEIRGAVVQDRSAFFVEAVAPGDFDGQPMRPYNVRPDALLLNFNAITLTLAAEANSVRVSAEPHPANLHIYNRLSLNHQATTCGEWRKALNAELQPGSSQMRLKLTGAYPAVCNEQQWNMAAMNNVDHVSGVFDALWGEITGKEKLHPAREGAVPENAQKIASLSSPTLGEVVRDINKYSNNVMARQLLLTLGMNSGQRPARTADGEAAIRAWMLARGLKFPELVIDNGAGLSRIERITAANMVRLLDTAWHSAVMPELMASLPIVAVDGTMKKRLKDNGIVGQAHIKTGSLDGVKTMAGYVLDKNGRRWAVAFMVSHPNAAQSGAAQDALLEWVYGGGL